ncbi:hypothetical protein C7H19_03470 [Aphanothece hegewaldii CCALA 016]|uniref:Uncharacterized protein n=1 Tax=Aphanothece hegewaldii CCALA 016 TaxID=2107694 RepID=A0A2T1M1J6_9CHRO|nr:hypothetical protein [Aphanothece hegewaldii]PSF38582.1 hypothetical protein C7H19_03470 [Aphanothece hegewaldii CCALA 016]
MKRILGKIIKTLMILSVVLYIFITPALAFGKKADTYYWIHIPTGGAPVFIGETEGAFVQDEYPLSHEAMAKILKVGGADLTGLQNQLKQYNFPQDVIDQFVGKSQTFQSLGISGGFTIVFHAVPSSSAAKTVETEYMCLLGGKQPQVVFAANVLGHLGAEEYNEGASGFTKDPLVVLGQEYYPASPEGMVTEFWVYANTTCFNVDLK